LALKELRDYGGEGGESFLAYLNQMADRRRKLKKGIGSETIDASAAKAAKQNRSLKV